MAQNPKIATVTTAPPPPREKLHAAIVADIPPGAPTDTQAAVALTLQRIGPEIDQLNHLTGRKYTIALASDSP